MHNSKSVVGHCFAMLKQIELVILHAQTDGVADTTQATGM